MPSPVETAATAIVERLLTLAAQDAEIRSHLRLLAKAFLDSTADESAEPEVVSDLEYTGTTQLPDQVEAVIQSIEAAISVVETPAVESLPLPELTLGRASSTKPAGPVYPVPKVSATDFATVEVRCRLKAEGTRWVATRRRLLADGAHFYTEIEPKDRDIIARAKSLPNCFLWMCHSSGPSPSNLALYEDVAGGFEAIAEAVALIRQIQDKGDAGQTEFEAALDLLAESQSALRVAIETIEGPADTDQLEVFHWLRATATENQIFIRRFMRLDDPADPAAWPDILARIEVVEARVEESQRRLSQRKKLLGKVRHKTTLILNDPAGAPEQWKILIESVVELVQSGLPPSNRELRELLIQVIDVVPEQEVLPTEFELVLREIDRFMATYPPPESQTAPRASLEVAEVSSLLGGRSLVLIGGDKRPGAYDAIREAFGLRELIWIETRAHESFATFEPFVARPEVAAVLLAIRWSSHSYGEVKQFCEAHDKPLVRLPGGYNPNQVAAQILGQCSERLRQ